MNLPYQLFVILLLTLLNFDVLATSRKPDSVTYKKYYEEAEVLRAKGKYQEALGRYLIAGAYADNTFRTLRINVRLAALHINLGQLDSAKLWIDRNLAISDGTSGELKVRAEIARTYNVMRQIGFRTGKYQMAVDALKKSIAILEKDEIDNPLLANGCIELGIAYWYMAEYDKCLEWCRKSLTVVPKLTGQDKLNVPIRAEMTMGLAFWNKRDLQRAVEYYRHVFARINNDRNGHARDYMLVCNNIGIVFFEQEMYDSASYYYERSLENLEVLKTTEFAPNIPEYKGHILGNIGLINAAIGNYAKAEEAYKESLRIKVAFYGETHRDIARIYLNLGNTYVKESQFDEARQCLNKALFIERNLKAGGSAQVSKVYNALGYLGLKENDLTTAQLYFDSAISKNRRIPLQNEVIYDNVFEIWYTFTGKMKVLAARAGQDAQSLAQIDELYQNIRSQLNYAFTRVSDPVLQSDARNLFNDLFDTYYALYDQSRQRKYIDRLWEISELKKGIRLNNKLNATIALNDLVPEDLVLKERALRDSIEEYSDKKWDNENVDSILFRFKRAYDEFVEEIESDYPEYYDLKYKIVETPLNEAQLRLPASKGILNFFESREHIYTLLITKDSVSISRASLTLVKELSASMNASIAKREKTWQQEADQLSSLLMAPGSSSLIGSVTSLDVLPDGISWNIHLTQLPTSIGSNSRPMGSVINIAYQYSFDHLRLRSRIRKANNRRMLAFSTSSAPTQSTATYFTFRDLDGQLPGAAKEVVSIADAWNGDYYLSSKATEKNFKEKCGDYQVIHLALHGASNDDEPAYSMLKFTPDSPDDDGLLHAHEIYGLDLGAELVVLSACHSGAGRIENGEGIESLGRAFAYAGANSLLLSRWEVSDGIAPMIMKYFYEGLQDGRSKSEALRLAKLKYLELNADNVTSAPFYWDSFYILGDDAPLTNNWPLRVWVGLAILVIAVPFGRILYRRRSTKSVKVV